MNNSTLLEPRDDEFTFGDDEETANDTKICGGRYTLKTLCDTFWVKIVDKPSPTPGELVKANAIITELYFLASREKMIAQALKRKGEITIFNTLMDNLEFCRKTLHMMVWSRGIEAKIGVE